MSLHKLTAGSGYDYLTRQVAALDATEKGHVALASYYTERGETPGVWMGSGMQGIEGLDVGDVVTADQMQALFGSGHHPLANQRRAALEAAEGPDAGEVVIAGHPQAALFDPEQEPVARRPSAASCGTKLTDRDYQAVTRLGMPYRVFKGDASPMRVEVAKRVAAVNEAAGLPADWPVPAADRARIRTDVARDFFIAEHGRDPQEARELAAQIAKHSRPKTQAVAGFDLTFSPVKSVSTLWAIADPPLAAKIELAHQAAIKDALTFLEQHALYSRTGTNGVRQVDVRGMVAAAFSHRDSRAGDPDLHTHVAVANKVQTDDGRWLSIDGRVLYKATVTASETYNTSLEKHLGDTVGLRFAERPSADRHKRPVREVVGVNPTLNQRWSARRASIEARRSELASHFQRTHGRPPTPVESLQLAQQATLETRDAKHEPRTLAEQRKTWHAEAVEVLGGERSRRKMVREALSFSAEPRETVDSAWVASAAGRVLAAMEARRSTWQVWHVRAEAQRQVRAANVPAGQVEKLVDLLVSDVLEDRSVSLVRPSDGIAEPEPLQRRDGASVYTVAGADFYTSARVIDAERRLVVMSGRLDGYAVDAASVDLALSASAANGLALNAGQIALVRQMATSGARLQLAIAPAGAGKTTAMRALAGIWIESGGTVIGLAPSAAAAVALGEQLGTDTDTLAKLTWSLDGGGLPEWAQQIGPSTLVVVDEAGMADTLSLDVVVEFVVGRGGSVRLIGDDQQLAAIGAGGVLRDIQTTHGALVLTELLRFADPAEGAASLALREGQAQALGFYLDNQRVHVGDLATLTEDVFSGWQADRGRGLDSIMLAPARDLVSELNQRARTHRVDGADPSPTLRLADGNEASVGELIITRSNDRRLRTSSTDWVKNGDRWTVLAIDDKDGLTVQHSRHGRTVRLPADYVQASTELGYATTVHTAQGVSVDTMHGLASGQESRQQLYTMMTRGRLCNAIYLDVVGDGDPHSVIRPEMVHPLTPTDLLQGILARDTASLSASSLLREQSDPAVRLAQATQRYVDALYVAAEDIVGDEVATALDVAAERTVPGLTEEAAWPTLRAHLMLLGAQGGDPTVQLQAAADARELGSAADKAAVLDWRLDDSGLRNAGRGPLPWVPGIPESLRTSDRWGDYLTQRSRLVETLAAHIHERAVQSTAVPVWGQQGAARLDASCVADVEVWRAAMNVPRQDRRPTGAPQVAKAAVQWQRQLSRRLDGDRTAAVQEWGPVLERISPSIRADRFTPVLAQRLAAMSHAGVDVRNVLLKSAANGTLPDDHAAAALWWRISRHLSPAVVADIDSHRTLSTAWMPRLDELVGGAERAAALRDSPWWPTLVTTVDHGLQRGWRIEDLIVCPGRDAEDVDACQAMVWRASILMDPVPPEEPEQFYGIFEDQPPEDLSQGAEPPWHTVSAAHRHEPIAPAPLPDHEESRLRAVGETVPRRVGDPFDSDDYVEPDLAVAAMVRNVLGPPEQTQVEIDRMLERTLVRDHSPVPRIRMIHINDLALEYFQRRFTDSGSWGRQYLHERFGRDLHGNLEFRPGQAPQGWTGLVQHLRRHGVTGQEMLAAGVATTASNGHLIDRFRDRVVFPITHHGDVLGFVGRRHPDVADDDNSGPKYLNTADTALFQKGAQLFVAGEKYQDAGAIPVIVEGPMDAIAITIATGGTHVGVAPLGTSLTEEQAAQLGSLGRLPIVATDGDLAGQVAAERDFWMLTPFGLDPLYAQLPTGSDPADLMARRGPEGLVKALSAARPLADVLINERLANLPPKQARLEAVRVVAALPPTRWDRGTDQISGRLRGSTEQTRRDLRSAVHAWNRDARKAAQQPLQQIGEVRARLVAAAAQRPHERWIALANELDPRLVHQGDWPALAAVIQDVHDQGHDVAQAARSLISEAPLTELPAQDLRYRLVARLAIDVEDHEMPASPTRPTAASKIRPRPGSPGPRPSGAFECRRQRR